MNLIIIVLVVVLVFFLYLYRESKKDKVVFVEQSELSNPSISIPPYGFHAWHYRLLERIVYYSGFWEPEFMYAQINQWESSNDRRAGELARMWFLNVRVERNGIKKRNYYSINKKGRQAILNFSNRF